MKHVLVLALMAVLGLGLTLPTPAIAQETNWTAVNLAVTDNLVLPAYKNFADTAAGLVPAANQMCSQTDAASLSALHAAFHQTMDAWQSIQHVQFGPVTYFNWNFRLQYWPDERNTGGRQLDTLLAAQDTSQLESANFERQSVGVQGFPALERLLFEETALSRLQEQPYACQLVQAIATNISTIATGIHSRWQDEFRQTIADADTRDYFENAQDATIDFYKALVETVRKQQEQKLVAVLGSAVDAARIRQAESWRSARSLRNLKLNVAALATLFDGSTPALSSALMPDDITLVRERFVALQTELTALPDSMAALLQTDAGYAQLASVRDSMDALFETLETALKNTDLYLGFNSLDGD